jgi:hypothetical protein
VSSDEKPTNDANAAVSVIEAALVANSTLPVVELIAKQAPACHEAVATVS